MALAITRRGLSAEELRSAARRAKDSDQARRLLAIALVLEGVSRTEAARRSVGVRDGDPPAVCPVRIALCSGRDDSDKQGICREFSRR